MVVLSSEERAASEISELDMNKIRNRLKELFPAEELTKYDEVPDVFVNKDDFSSYIQSNERNKKLGKVYVSNTEDYGKRIKTNKDSNNLSAITPSNIKTQSVEGMQEIIDERNLLTCKLHDLLPDQDSKKVLTRFIELTRKMHELGEKQLKKTDYISTEAVIHYEGEQKSSKELTALSNYLLRM